MPELNVKVEIHDATVDERRGKSQRTGNDYVMRSQEAWVQIGNAPYPQKIKLRLEDGQSAYAVGNYQLHDRSFSVGKYGDLEVAPFLVPIQSTVQSVQKASA